MSKRKSNAELLKLMLKINEDWSKSHDGEELITEKCAQVLKETIDDSVDDDDLNRKFNKKLKSRSM